MGKGRALPKGTLNIKLLIKERDLMMLLP